MRNLHLILFIIFSINCYAQKWQGKIIGLFEKEYGGTYTLVKLRKDMSFTYKWNPDLMNYELNGVYKIIGDTLLLNSKEDYITPEGNNISMINEKWIILNKNKIFQGDTLNLNMIYGGYYLKRNRKLMRSSNTYDEY